MDPRAGRSAERTYEVGPDDTAAALGSGTLPVLGTPRLLAWAEATTTAALDGALEPGTTSVGVRVSLDHTAPSAVDDRVTLRAEVVAVDERRITFAVVATAGDGTEVGRGTVERVVVDAVRFTARLRQD